MHYEIGFAIVAAAVALIVWNHYYMNSLRRILELPAISWAELFEPLMPWRRKHPPVSP